MDNPAEVIRAKLTSKMHYVREARPIDIDKRSIIASAIGRKKEIEVFEMIQDKVTDVYRPIFIRTTKQFLRKLVLTSLESHFVGTP